MKYIIGVILFALATASWAEPQIYIHTMFSEITPYYGKKLIHNLNNAKPGDLITIDINSPGGSVSETLRIVNAMVTTKGFIVCNIRNASSGAAIIVMNCHEKILSPRGRIMFHYASNITRLNPIVPKYIEEGDSIAETLTKLYMEIKAMYVNLGLKDLMTEEEWAYLNDGEDIVWTTEEFGRRCLKTSSCVLNPRIGK